MSTPGIRYDESGLTYDEIGIEYDQGPKPPALHGSGTLFAPNSRYRFETRTPDGKLICIFPHINAQLYFFISKPDTCTVYLPMWYPKVQRSTLREVSMELWVWKMYPDTLTERLIFSGPIWTIYANSGDQLLQVYAEGLMSYFDKRIVDEDRIYTGEYTWNIAADLANYSQALTDGDKNVAIFSSFLTPEDATTIDVTYFEYEQRIISDVWSDLATGELNQLEYIVDYPSRTLIFFPGKLGNVRPVRLYYGHEPNTNVASYALQILGKITANSVVNLGPGEGAAMLLERVSDPASRAFYGLMQKSISSKDAPTAQQVQDEAFDYIQLYGVPRQYPQFVLRNGAIDMFDSTIEMGDTVTMVIDDNYIQFNQQLRTTGFGLTIGSEDQETIVIYTEDPIDV